jgi:hypothetical protein
MYEYKDEDFEHLLRGAKVTQKSIQTASQWMLERRGYMSEMVQVWIRLMKENNPKDQIVFLYVANDAIQIGIRKYGKHVIKYFEEKMPFMGNFIMIHAVEKVKRCLLKIIGVWKDRSIFQQKTIRQLEKICAGQTYTEEDIEAMEVDTTTAGTTDQSLKNDDANQKVIGVDKNGDDFLSEESIERVLLGMEQVKESQETQKMTTCMQNLVSATISTDLLSDRMFQLQSSLLNFQHACDAYTERQEEKDLSNLPTKNQGQSKGQIEWDLMEQQVFDLDIERAKDHVQQFRENLEDQIQKRELLIEYLRSLFQSNQHPQQQQQQQQKARTMIKWKEQEKKLEEMYMMSKKALEIQQKKEETNKQQAQINALANAFQEQKERLQRTTSSDAILFSHQIDKDSSFDTTTGNHTPNKRPRLLKHSHSLDLPPTTNHQNSSRANGGSRWQPKPSSVDANNQMIPPPISGPFRSMNDDQDRYPRQTESSYDTYRRQEEDLRQQPPQQSSHYRDTYRANHERRDDYRRDENRGGDWRFDGGRINNRGEDWNRSSYGGGGNDWQNSARQGEPDRRGDYDRRNNDYDRYRLGNNGNTQRWEGNRQERQPRTRWN